MSRWFPAKTHVANSFGYLLNFLIASLILGCWCSAKVTAQSLPQQVSENPAPTSAGHQHNSRSAEKELRSSAPAASELGKRPGAVTIGKIQIAIPDLIVLDQDGKEKRFYSDLIKDRVVVLSFFFTSCVSVCPAMNLALAKLQTNLSDRIGKDVFIVTVTKDPETDTPPRLKAWGNSLHVKRGWTMITGKTDVIGKIVRDFTGDRLGKDSHNTIFFIGNDKTGKWVDVFGFSTAEDLRRQLDVITTSN
jgi:protein SCO1/2